MQLFDPNKSFLVAALLIVTSCGQPTAPPEQAPNTEIHTQDGAAEITAINDKNEVTESVDLRFYAPHFFGSLTYDSERRELIYTSQDFSSGIETSVTAVSLREIAGIPDSYRPSIGDRLRCEVRVTSPVSEKELAARKKLESALDQDIESEETDSIFDLMIASSANIGTAKLSDIACETIAPRPRIPENVTQLHWATIGGGSLEFKASLADGHFNIEIIEYAFREVSRTASLKDPSLQAYQVMNAIFTGERDLFSDTYIPTGTSGSWTSIKLRDAAGEWTHYKHVGLSSDLHTLYEYAALVAGADQSADDTGSQE